MLKHWKRTTIIAALCAIVAVPAIINVASTGENIAPSSEVQSECPSWALASLGPEKLIDGNKTNFSTSTYENNADTVKDVYLTFDETYRVDEVRLYPRVSGTAYAGGFPKDFTVSLWDGKTWVEVANRKNYSATNDALTLEFEEKDYRALRIRATKLDLVDGGPKYGLQIAEIEVFGKTTSELVDAPVIYMNAVNAASISEIQAECPSWALADLGPGKMIDSNKTNFSTSTYENSADIVKDIYLTFDSTYSINEVVLYPRTSAGAYAGGFPKEFTVSLWDGTRWEEVLSKTNYNATGDALDITFVAKEYRAMRIHATKLDNVDNGAQYGLQLAEIEVKGVASSESIDAPTILLGASNVAMAGDITAECPTWALGSIGPEKMIDGNKENYSTSTYMDSADETKQIQLVLDAAYKVNEVILYPRVSSGAYAGGFPKDFAVSMWNGTEWIEVASRTDYVSSSNGLVLNFAAGDYRAVRISTSKLDHVDGGSQFGLQLAEIEVYGVQADGDVTPPPTDDQEEEEEPENPVNIALNGEVLSECPSWAMANLGPEKMNDGNTTNFSTSTYVDKAETVKEVYLTFDKTYKVSEVAIYPRTANDVYAGGFPKDFTVSIWDGEEWVEVASKTDMEVNADKVTITFEAADARAVRIKATKLTQVDGSSQFGLQLAELEVYGVTSQENIEVPNIQLNPDDGANNENENEPFNVALESDVLSECPGWAMANLGPEKMVDGNTTNFSTSTYVDKAETEKEIYVTFDQAYKVDEITLYPRTDKGEYAGGFPEDFTVSIWNGEKWVEVATKTGMKANAEKVTITFEATDARALYIKATKLTQVDGGTQFGLQLAEIEARGVASQENIEAPNVQLKPDGEGDDGQDENASFNVALEADVVAECPGWALASIGPEKMVDGNITNYSTSTYTDKADTVKEVYIMFDKTYKVDEITLYPRVENGKYVGGFPKDFTVSVWTGTTWKKVVSKKGVKATAKELTLSFKATDARAVRIQATKLSKTDDGTQYALQLAEITVNGTKTTKVIKKPKVKLPSDDNSGNKGSGNGSVNNDLYGGASNGALYGIVTAECPQWALASVGPEKLVDANRTNFYTSSYVGTPRTTKEVYVTFEKTHSIHTISIYPRVENGKYVGGFPENFTVSVWTGTQWKQVGAKTGYVSGITPVTFKFSSIICNGIRIQATRLSKTDDGTQFALQLAELEALGSESNVKLKAPVMTSEEELKVTIDNDKNIALNAPAKASSDWAQYGAGVTNINDGDIGSFFATDGNIYKDGDTVWAEINLLDNYSINTVILAARSKAWGFPYDFTISVFYDGKWTDVVTEKNFEADESNTISLYEFKFSPVIGNKVRISSNNFRKADNDKTFIIGEMAVYGTKAKGKYVIPNENMISTNTTILTTTTMNDYGYYLNHLNDGDLKTEWSSVPSTSADDEQIIEVDFKREVQMGEVQLKPSWGGNGFPSDFVIEVFEKEKWVKVYSATDYEKPIDEAIQRFSFEARRGTKFRVVVKEQAAEGGLYVVKLNQIMAYPNATGDDFDDDKVVEVKSEKQYQPTEGDVKNEKASLPFNVMQLLVGLIFLIISASGCIWLIKQLDKKGNK